MLSSARSSEQRTNEAEQPIGPEEDGVEPTWTLNLSRHEDTVRVDLRGDTASPSKRRRVNFAAAAVYRMDTLARIVRSPSRPGFENVSTSATDFHCHGAISPGACCILVSRQVYVLDGTCSDHKATLTLDCEPELVTFSRDSSFLGVCDSLGSIHFIHMQSGNTIFSEKIFNRPNLSAKKAFAFMRFTSPSSVGTEELIVMATNNMLYRFSPIDTAKLEKAILENDPLAAEEITSEIAKETVDLGKYPACHKSVEDVAVRYDRTGSTLIVGGSGRTCVSFWRRTGQFKGEDNKTEMVDGILRLLRGRSVKRLRLTETGQHLVMADNRGGLSVWQYNSLVMLYSYPDANIDNFDLISTSGERADKSSRVPIATIVALTGADDGDHGEVKKSESPRSIRVFSVPGGNVFFEIEVAALAWLVKSQGNTMENGRPVYFLEGKDFSDSPSLLLRSLSETVPTSRLTHLLEANRFDEALSFAETFNLDKQAVLRARLAYHARHMTNLADQGIEQIDIGQLTSELDQIQDVRTAVTFCLETAFPSYKATLGLLRHARDIVQRSLDAGDTDLRDLCGDVQAAIRALGTWQLISGCGSPKRTSDCESPRDHLIPFDGQAWQAFRSADIITQLRTYVARGMLDKAVVIWRRHYSEENMLPQIADILKELPGSVPVGMYTSWIRNDVLPLVTHPEERAKLDAWATERAIAIEIHEKKPHNALMLARLLDISSKAFVGELDTSAVTLPALTPASFVERTILLASGVKRSADHESSSDLANGLSTTLIRQLEDLVYLWDVHGLHLSLAEYSQSTARSIAFCLIDRVAAPELLHDAVTNHFRKYVDRIGHLSHDQLLVEYCRETMLDRGVGVPSENAPWEPRVMAILHSITDDGARLEVILEIMRRTPVPWSDAVERVIQEALTQKRLRRNGELEELYRFMHLKKMLRRYGFLQLNTSSLSDAKGIVSHIVSHVDTPSAMEDALQVVNAFHGLSKVTVYVQRTQSICAANRPDLLLALLNTMCERERDEVMDDAPLPNIVYKVGQETLTWLVETMEGIFNAKTCSDYYCAHQLDDSTKVTYQWASNCAVQLTEYLMKKNRGGCSSRLYVASPQLLSSLQSSRTLFNKFGMAVRPSMLQSDEVKLRLVKQLTDRMVAGDGISSDSWIKSTQQNVYHIADAMNLSRFKLKGSLAEEAVLRGDLRGALLLFREISEKMPGRQTADLLRRAASQACAYLADHCGDINPKKFANTHMTQRIQRLSQQSLVMCVEQDIGALLDEFKNYEIQNAVFTHSEHGEYSVLVRAVPVTDVDGGSAADCSSKPTFAVGSCPSENCNSVDISDTFRDSYAAELFENTYVENGLVMNTASAISRATSFVDKCRSVENQNFLPSNGDLKGKSKAVGSNSESFAEASEQLITYLTESRVYQVGIQVYIRAQEHAIRTGETGESGIYPALGDAKLYCEILEHCMQKALGSRFIDNSLSIAYMISLPLDKAFGVFRAALSTVGTAYNRLIGFATIGMNCATIWRQRTFFVDCKQLGANAHWWHQLKLFGIPFDDAQFRMSKDGTYQRKLIPLLLEKTTYDVMTVLEFGRVYDIEDDFVLFEFIEGLLLSPTSSDYQTQVSAYISDVVNKPKLLSLLVNECLPRISPYDYERLGFVLNRIQDLDPEQDISRRGLAILECLKNYRRLFLPDATELSAARSGVEGVPLSVPIEDVEHCRRRFSGCTRRLPFHRIKEEPWTVLEPELTEESVSRLLSLVDHLRLNSDKFYETVIRNIVNSMTSAKPPFGREYKDMNSAMNYASSLTLPSLMVGAAKTDLKFSDLRALIVKIQDAQLAINSAKYVADFFPCGENKIQALKAAVGIAERWHQRCAEQNENNEGSEAAKTEFTRLRESLAQAETEHQLRICGLSRFLEYLSNPLELVCQLYTDLSEQALKEKDFPDLHVITSDIARRHSLDVEKIRQYLIRKWLTKECDASAEERKRYLPSARIQPGVYRNESACAKKEQGLQNSILYLLKNAAEKNVTLLLNFAYQSSQKITTLVRVRALSVLFQLVDAEEIGKVHNYADVKTYLQVLLYLADFEEQRISQSLKEFNSCQKDALARSLWVAHSDEHKVVQLICNICLDYRIYDPTLWESALQRLLKFGLAFQILGFLEHVTAIPELAHMKSLPQVWGRVIMECLIEIAATGDNTEETKAARTRVCVFLQKCSYLPELDLACYLNQIMRFASDQERKVEALRMLTYFPSTEEVLRAAEEAAAGLGAPGMKGALRVLESKDLDTTDLGISSGRIVEVVYTTIHERRLHRELFDVPLLLRGYVLYLIARSPPSRLHEGFLSLMRDVMEAGKKQEASMIAGRWSQEWGEDLDVSGELAGGMEAKATTGEQQ